MDHTWSQPARTSTYLRFDREHPLKAQMPQNLVHWSRSRRIFCTVQADHPAQSGRHADYILVEGDCEEESRFAGVSKAVHRYNPTPKGVNSYFQ